MALMAAVVILGGPEAIPAPVLGRRCAVLHTRARGREAARLAGIGLAYVWAVFMAGGTILSPYDSHTIWTDLAQRSATSTSSVRPRRRW